MAMGYVTVKNKKSNMILNTEDDGLFVTINFMADGEYEIEEIGVCIDNFNRIEPDTIEEYNDREMAVYIKN